MVYSDTGERYLTKHEEHYLKSGDVMGVISSSSTYPLTGDVTDSISSSSTYPDMWRPGSPADKSDLSSRSPLELHTGGYAPVGVGVGVGMGGGGLGGGGGMCGPHEMENFHNVLAFSPCPPSYKEFAVFKEKSSHDVTDALLSLKNAIVHPSFAGSQLSPLSPTMHLGPLTPTGINGQGQQPLAYTVNHSTQVHPMSYSGRSSPQYPSVHAQIHGDHINTHQQHGHSVFPAMSVNVSMSMNVVPPNFANNQYNPGQQWQSPSQHYNMDQEYPHSPQEAAFQTQYNPYSQNYYSQSYSISPDFRSAMTENRNFYYKTADEFKSSNTRYYTSAHFKRAKFIDDKSLHISANSPDNSKINLCRICGKTYARPSTLKTHLRTHSGEKPYKCNACNKSFSQAANLTAHARTHSGEKPFHCPVCDRHFSQSSSVTTHMRTHSGERPYRCRLCKKAFSDSSTLTKHLRIHSGEKPYQCKLCLLRFSQSGNLNRHMRVHSSNG